jgi:hypothetical protein
MPIVVAPPARFSTTTDWPMLSENFGETMRITESVAPPGAKGTITRNGLAGYAGATLVAGVCACTAAEPAHSAASNNKPRRARQVTPDAMVLSCSALGVELAVRRGMT